MRLGLPAKPAEGLPNGLLADPHSPANLAVGMTFCLEALDQTCPRLSEPLAALRETSPVPQGRQTALLKSLLVPTNGSLGAAEGPRHVILVSPALFDEVHHGVRLGHTVTESILREQDAGDDDHSVSILGPNQTAAVDDHSAFRS